MLRSLFHGLYEILDVPARVSLRVLVQLLGSPLGLLAGREARDPALWLRYLCPWHDRSGGSSSKF